MLPKVLLYFYKTMSSSLQEHLLQMCRYVYHSLACSDDGHLSSCFRSYTSNAFSTIAYQCLFHEQKPHRMKVRMSHNQRYHLLMRYYSFSHSVQSSLCIFIHYHQSPYSSHHQRSTQGEFYSNLPE